MTQYPSLKTPLDWFIWLRAIYHYFFGQSVLLRQTWVSCHVTKISQKSRTSF